MVHSQKSQSKTNERSEFRRQRPRRLPLVSAVRVFFLTSWPKYRIRLDYFVCPAKKKAKRILLGGNRMSNRGFRRLPLSSRLELASPNSKEVPAFVVDVEHGLSDSTCMYLYY